MLLICPLEAVCCVEGVTGSFALAVALVPNLADACYMDGESAGEPFLRLHMSCSKIYQLLIESENLVGPRNGEH